MALRARRHTVVRMRHLARTAELMRMAPHVYGAALAAARDERAAAGVTESVLGGAASEPLIAREALVERAILNAVRGAPAPCFERMPQPGRDAVALARLAGLSADQVAARLELGVDEVKRGMLEALQSTTLQAAA